MLNNRSRVIATAALAAALTAGPPLSAAEFVYGSWLPAREYMNANVMPGVLEQIDKETSGQIKWKLVPGGQLADGRATFNAVQDNVMQAGIAIPLYVPSAVPSINVLYSTVLFGDDVVAASGAVLETMTLNCPSCIEEAKKLNSVPLAGWVAAPYQLLCREAVKTVADIKGKRIRALGGGADMLKSAGAVTIGGTLTEAVNLLQRGGLDCVLGAADWLRTFGYADFAKFVTDYPLGMTGPAVGFMLNRDTWNKFTPEQKQAHLRAAARQTAETAIGSFIVSNEASLQDAIKNKGVSLVKVGKDFDELTANYKKSEAERVIAQHQQFGVKNAGALMDAYTRAFERWKGLSKDIGRDPKKFTDAIMREIYSKADLSKL
jgi:TRAP-type C4-dicarboxylate transport system substrate-binding protein